MASSTAPPRVVQALSLTAWFFHPAVAMPGWEVLSQATAFAVAARTPGVGARRHLITSAHVVRPQRFPRYYPPERYPFLAVLEDEHVRLGVELRAGGSGGQVVAGARLRSRVHVHPTHDVAVVHAEDDEELDAALAAAGATLRCLELRVPPIAAGEALSFAGHVLGDPGPAADRDGAPMLPRLVHGAFLARSPRQSFATTSQPLAMGMCGGPVLRRGGGVRGCDGGGSECESSDEDECVGVVEGVVQALPPAGGAGGGVDAADARAASLLSGSAVFVESPLLRDLCARVEAGMLLQGRQPLR